MSVLPAAVFDLAFALFHLTFWRLFHWKDELAKLDKVNRGVMQILNICLTFLFLAIGFLLIHFRSGIADDDIGKALLVMMTIFWVLRAGLQMIFFGSRNRLSLAMTLLFDAGALLHFLPLVV